MEIGHKKPEGIEELNGQKWAPLASATNLGNTAMDTQKSPEIRNGDELIPGLSTAAGGETGDGKNEVLIGQKFDILSLYNTSCFPGFIFTSLRTVRGSGFTFPWAGIMTNYILFFYPKIMHFSKKNISNRHPGGS